MAHAFSYMNLVEAWGSGIPKLMDAVSAYGLQEPEFIDMEIGFRINLYRKENVHNVPENVRNVSKNVHKQTLDDANNLANDFLSRLLRSLETRPEITQKMLGEELGVSAKTVQRALAKLQQDGVIVREGSNRKGKWVIV